MEQLATGFLPNKAVEKTDTDQVFMNKRMKAAQVGKPGGDWELVERDVPEPGADGRGLLEAILTVYAIADRNGDAAQILDGIEGVLIGEIVADEHGLPA